MKIDKSFVSPLVVGDAQASAVPLRAAVGMALGLGLRVVAEGVESPQHLALLRHLGCHEAQGYHLGRPADPETLDVTTAQWSMPPADGRLLRADPAAVAAVPRVMPALAPRPSAPSSHALASRALALQPSRPGVRVSRPLRPARYPCRASGRRLAPAGAAPPSAGRQQCPQAP